MIELNPEQNYVVFSMEDIEDVRFTETEDEAYALCDELNKQAGERMEEVFVIASVETIVRYEMKKTVKIR